MKLLRATVRAVIVLAVLGIGTLLMMVAALLRLTWRGVPLSFWIAVSMARIFNVVYNVRLESPDWERLRTHTGFIVPNHLSYLDIIVLYSATPVRFLAAIEVKQRPVLGWAASLAGTAFVDRTNMRSRREALSSMASAYEEHPDIPVIVFPEGKLGTGKGLFRFQIGVFKLAKQHSIAYLPVAIQYSHPEIVIWSARESMVQAVWRLAAVRGPITATLTPLEPVLPAESDNAARLADAAQDAIAQVLGYGAEKVEE